MISLRRYVERRNGVPLGHSDSLVNMLKRSFGAKSFDVFWLHWNPIWNYYLTLYVYRFLKLILNRYFATVMTFGVSGLIHDLVGFMIYNKLSFLITTWFVIMGIIVVIFKFWGIRYSKASSLFSSFINMSIIAISLYLAKFCLMS